MFINVLIDAVSCWNHCGYWK